jgi:hypothetical protein
MKRKPVHETSIYVKTETRCLRNIYLPEDGKEKKKSWKYLSEEGNRTSIRNTRMYLPEDGDRTNVTETSIRIFLNMAIKAPSETSVYMMTDMYLSNTNSVNAKCVQH